LEQARVQVMQSDPALYAQFVSETRRDEGEV